MNTLNSLSKKSGAKHADNEASIAQHLRYLISAKRPVEKKDRRFLRLPPSTRILQSLPSLRLG